MKMMLRSNTTLDALRIFMILMIIYLHCQPLISSLVVVDPTLNFIYDKLSALVVLALPIFFAVSGYFLAAAGNDNARWRKLVKLVKILLWAELLYLIISLAVGGVMVNLLPFFDLQNWLKMFTAAVPIPIAAGVSNLPLWYLLCLSIVSFVDWFAGKYRAVVMAAMAVIGFLIGNLHGLHSGFAESTVVIPLLDRIFGTELDYLTQGFLFIAIGYFVYRFRARIATISPWFFAVAIPMGVWVFWLERQFATANGFVVPLLTALIVTWAVVQPKLFNGRLKWLAYLGGRYSLYIYIFHPIIIFGLNCLTLPWLMPANLLTIFGYWLVVAVLSVLVSIGFVWLKDKVVARVKNIRKVINGKVKKLLA